MKEEAMFKNLKVRLVGLSALALIVGSVQGGSLEPPGPPGPTMKTLDEIPPTWSQVLPVSQRFVLVMGGFAVLDKETGLVWQREPWGMHLVNQESWADASIGCYRLNLGGRMGWRLPTVEELLSLADISTGLEGKYLPIGHPFTQISDTAGYWTSTTAGAAQKFVLAFPFLLVGQGAPCLGPPFPCTTFGHGARYGLVSSEDETTSHDTWCVRGGNGHDGQ